MPAEPFQYAVLRIVPRVDRGERMNVGVVVFCRTLRFLDCRIGLPEPRRALVLALDPAAELGTIDAHLRVIEQIVRGDPAGGPMAALAQPERFRWITSPSSTVIQPSDVHSGLTEDPETTLDRLFVSQVG